MKENELRLGNKLTNFLGEVFDCNAETIRSFESNYFPYGKPLPIPLTEEWLLKFGFEYETLFDCDGGEYYSYVKGQFMLYNSEYCDVFKCDLNENYDVDVTEVHQLQNLYFALTNEELEINE